MKKHLLLILISIVIITGCSSEIDINHHAVHIITYASNQGTSPNIKIIPFDINKKAIDLTKNLKANQVLKNYIIWYLNHLNYEDNFGLSGTINNYIIDKDGNEEKLGEYTSLAGTAATFLILIDLYLKKTRHIKLIDNYKKKINDIVYLFIKLQNKRGILSISPINKNCLLSENCIVAGGIRSYLRICKQMGWEFDKTYTDLASTLPKKIIAEFYNPDKRDFYWKIRAKIKIEPDWKKHDPDIYSQIFPLYFKIINRYGIIGASLWEKIKSNWDSDNMTWEYRNLLTEFKSKNKVMPNKKINKDIHPVFAIEGKNKLKNEGKMFHYVPYKTTLKAINQIIAKENKIQVRDYIRWYLDKINLGDINGNNGTVYQYILSSFKKDQPLFKENRTVLTSSLFFILISEYLKLTNDGSLFSEHKSQIEDMIYLIHHFQDNDGLIKMDAFSEKKTLIDNVLALYTLKLYTGNKYFRGGDKLSEYRSLAKVIDFEMKRRFFSKDKKYFFKEISGNEKILPDMKKMYPDMFSQIFPFSFDVENFNSDNFLLIRYRINSKIDSLRKSIPDEWQFVFKKFTMILNKKDK